MTIHYREIKANLSSSTVRREQFDGRPHVVAPVVMIVEGVLNDGLLTEQEFGRFVWSWNGRPVPVLHPMKNGVHVSANQPDIIEKNTIGHIFNASAGDGKLKAELWLDIQKAEKLGHDDLVAGVEEGRVIEVSTGYQCIEKKESGTFNGKPYSHIDTNIMPDHLALLPGEVGACSVADGCGTRANTNKGFALKINRAINVITQALGMRTNCKCNEDDTMTIEQKLKAQAEKLKANGKLTPEQVETIIALDEEQLNTVSALAFALLETGGVPAEDGSPDAEDEAMMEEEDGDELLDEEGKPVVNKKAVRAKKHQAVTMTPEKIDQMVANRVQEHIERSEVTGKLLGNEKCPFTKDEMASMSVNHLKKLEASIRPADYSGQGGFATNTDAAVEKGYQPLTIHSGLTARKQKQEA